MSPFFIICHKIMIILHKIERISLNINNNNYNKYLKNITIKIGRATLAVLTLCQFYLTEIFAPGPMTTQ